MSGDAQDTERLNIFTWNVHGSYLYYLSQAKCDFYLPVNDSRADGYGGKTGDYPFGSNVHEVPIESVKETDFDVILFQDQHHYEVDQHNLFSPKQLQLPKIYLEHNPPRDHATDTKHFVNDRDMVLVHVTPYNRLMWDSNQTQTVVIEHGVMMPEVKYTGELERGIVVVNNLGSGGRRLGLDIFEQARSRVPLDLIGIESEKLGGLGAIPHNKLADFLAQYRFFFSPIRYTSLPLSALEAMMVGLPYVGVSATEMTTVIRSGVNGFISYNLNELIGQMKNLLDSPKLAQNIGAVAKASVQSRFSIDRFTHYWERLFESMWAGHQPTITHMIVAEPNS